MKEFTSFRGVDLTARKQKIANAMNLVPPKSGADIPVITHHPCYFGFGCAPRSPRYWEDPAYMLAFQQDGYEQHLKTIDDDFVPYFMPWFGTGVLASGFGCEIKPATGNGDDPAVASHVVHDLEDLAHLKMPNPETDGWMPKVLEFMDYAVQHGEMPVGLTDMNSPLCTAAQICGYENLFYWMIDEPEAVNDLLDMVCEAFIQWTRLQRSITGEAPGMSNGLQGIYTPRGGIWLSDDDLVSMGAAMYEEYMVPRYSKIFTEFGGGHIHWCGNGRQQVDNLLKIKGLTAINNCSMFNFEASKETYSKVSGKLCIELQEGAPADPWLHYRKLFSVMPSLTGVLINSFLSDGHALDQDGFEIPVSGDTAQRGNDLVKAVRSIADEMLASQK